MRLNRYMHCELCDPDSSGDMARAMKAAAAASSAKDKSEGSAISAAAQQDAARFKARVVGNNVLQRMCRWCVISNEKLYLVDVTGTPLPLSLPFSFFLALAVSLAFSVCLELTPLLLRPRYYYDYDTTTLALQWSSPGPARPLCWQCLRATPACTCSASGG